MVIIIFFVYTTIVSTNALKCDKTFESYGVSGNKRGTFQSPLFPEKYPSNVRCIYKFVGRSNEKVTIRFQHFYIEGLLAKCKKDFLDIYIEMRSLQDSMADSTSLGRFCGRKLDFVPNVIVSLYNIVILDFYAAKNTQTSYNQDGHMGLLGFNGTYRFDSNAPYTPGLPAQQYSKECNFVIKSTNQREGPINSPTYPGIYPSNINCSYQLLGQSNQRIRLMFKELDLNHQMNECIDDYVIVFDGKDENSPVIGGRFCGRHKNLKFVSTSSNLYIRFVTGSSARRVMNIADSVTLQRRGFTLVFKFSSEFISVSTSSLSQYHIRGTECDLLIKSKGKSKGRLYSLGYPKQSRVPPGRLCRFYLYGIHNRQQMETAVLRFDGLHIPASPDNKCSIGSLSIYSVRTTLRRIELHPTPVKFPKKPDHVLCGTKSETIPIIRCRAPLVMLQLNTTNSFKSGIGGFSVRYEFRSDFGISSGSMLADDRCHFVYNISHGQSGSTNSPFYGGLYPANISCQYDFIGKPDYRIRIYFKSFALSDTEIRRQKYHQIRNTTCKKQDRLLVIEDNAETFYLCGSSTPGPILTRSGSTKLTLIFQSDSSKSYPGFLVQYHFIAASTISQYKCGRLVESKKGGGVITSYKYPLNYPKNVLCEWIIKAQSKTSRIMVRFHDFVVEGLRQSCANTVLRIYEGNSWKASSELCGTDSSIPAFISLSSEIRLRFITSPDALGQKGFKLVWSEIYQSSSEEYCNGFRCDHTKYCINKELECDRVSHCGTYMFREGTLVKSITDNTDEEKNCPVASSYNLLHIGLGIIITMLILILLVVYVLYKEHRKQHRKSIRSTAALIAGGQPSVLDGGPLYPNSNSVHHQQQSSIPPAPPPPPPQIAAAMASQHSNPLSRSMFTGTPGSAGDSAGSNSMDVPDSCKLLTGTGQHYGNHGNHVNHAAALLDSAIGAGPASANMLLGDMPQTAPISVTNHAPFTIAQGTTSTSSRPNSNLSRRSSRRSSRRQLSSTSLGNAGISDVPLVMAQQPRTPSMTSLRRAQSTRQLQYEYGTNQHQHQHHHHYHHHNPVDNSAAGATNHFCTAPRCHRSHQSHHRYRNDNTNDSTSRSLANLYQKTLSASPAPGGSNMNNNNMNNPHQYTAPYSTTTSNAFIHHQSNHHNSGCNSRHHSPPRHSDNNFDLLLSSSSTGGGGVGGGIGGEQSGSFTTSSRKNSLRHHNRRPHHSSHQHSNHTPPTGGSSGGGQQQQQQHKHHQHHHPHRHHHHHHQHHHSSQPHHQYQHQHQPSLNYEQSNSNHFCSIPTANYDDDDGVWTREKMQKISIV